MRGTRGGTVRGKLSVKRTRGKKRVHPNIRANFPSAGLQREGTKGPTPLKLRVSTREEKNKATSVILDIGRKKDKIARAFDTHFCQADIRTSPVVPGSSLLHDHANKTRSAQRKVFPALDSERERERESLLSETTSPSLAKAKRPIVTTRQRRYNHEFVLGVSISLSPDSATSFHRKLLGGGLPIPSISGRDAARRIASVRIRFEVFADKPPCRSEGSDNEAIVLFRRENSPATRSSFALSLSVSFFLSSVSFSLSFLYFSHLTQKIAIDEFQKVFLRFNLKLPVDAIDYWIQFITSLSSDELSCIFLS